MPPIPMPTAGPLFDQPAAPTSTTPVEAPPAPNPSDSPTKPDALPGIKPRPWQSISLAWVLSRNPEIAAKLTRINVLWLGQIPEFYTNRIFDAPHGLTIAECDTLANELDRFRQGSDGFAAAVSRRMLGFVEPEGSVKR